MVLYSFKTSNKVSSVVALSPDNSSLLINGTLAPYFFAISAISLLSVDTITSSNILLSIAALIEYAIIGLPQNSFIFFFGILLLPPRAVIIAIDL